MSEADYKLIRDIPRITHIKNISSIQIEVFMNKIIMFHE